jgi:hypothetical protein
MLKKLFENFALKWTDWLFRAKTPEALLLKSAGGILVLVYGAPSLVEVLLRLFLDSVPESYKSAKQIISMVDGLILSICTIMILVSIGLIIYKFIVAEKSKQRKRVIVVEGRGLRDDDGSPLEEAVSKVVEGNITPILLDLRNNMDGKVIEPQMAVNKIISSLLAVKQHSNGERRDLTLVYGGLTSVPYTFLTGLLIDDENNVITYDWDRRHEKWRSLDEIDDGDKFLVQGLNDVYDSEDVVIALAYSYPIEDADLKNTFTYPLVRLTLNEVSSDAHWSKDKQNRLAQEFFEVVKLVSAKGVKRIHLVMAAPNSVVFTFGRRYDKRNLPEVVVYQFERGKYPAYPWGIQMPVSGGEHPNVVSTVPSQS